MFTSFSFVTLFLPIVLWGVVVFRSWSREACIAWLFLASLAFYGLISPRHLPLLVLSIGVNLAIAHRMSLAPLQARRKWLIVGIVFDLGLLSVFKYLDFAASILSMATGWAIAPYNLALPVGISFYTFTQIAFLVDHYRATSVPRSATEFGLFVSYFPHLVAGPVLYHRQIMPQFASPRFAALDSRDLVIGGLLFVIGLAKKLLIGDSLAPMADSVFTAVRLDAVLTFWEAWIGLIAYALHLYFDFSGYSDMAIGLSCMLGVTIPPNFNSPYRATSLIEFWRRWHISLSMFLRDYLYVPLGGNRGGKGRRYVNVLTTMLLGGLWHGAGWGFVIWGLIHGVAIVANQAYREWRGALPARSTMRRLLFVSVGWAATQFVVIQAWAFFRADSVAAAWRLLTVSWGFEGIGLPASYAVAVAKWNALLGYLLFNADGGFLTGSISTQFSERYMLAVGCAIVLLLPNSQTLVAFFNDRVCGSQTRAARVILYAVAVATGLVLGTCMLLFQRNSPFIYGNF